ncbi:hypothetical protein BWK63_07440 [Flavobacterium covae]|uniref:Restriction endonuclease n=1 Tax=Flavobacterium covae TaxID=2906076 RepID=A0ABW8PI36_9FLAO|nr:MULTISPECIES: hypothetical protein [Flavobacterium]OWP81137.1 hypothetical protein BWK63_07440 [Flavobacterium covae]POR22770.1 hypothetical protein BWK57_04810 [Flavobacterium columnare]
MTNCENILKQNGPMMSGALGTLLVNQYGLIANTASKIIVRDKTIKRISGFYVSGQHFCFLEEHKNKTDFFDIFQDSLFNYGKKYWYVLNALKMCGGIVSKKYLECYTNYPILPLSSHKPFNEILDKFIEQGILMYNNECYMLSPKYEKSFTNYSHYTAIESIKDNVLDNFRTFSKNIGLISYKTGESFAEYGKFRFGFKGVSYVSGLMQGSKNGFVVADILIGHPIYESDIKFFIDKLDTISKFKNSPRLIPFLIVDNLNDEALRLLKSKGVIIGFIEELFGEKYAKTLVELVNILNNAGASLKQTPEKYLDLIKQLKKYNEGLANNIKGTLFEFVIGHIHSTKCQSLDLGREIIDENGKHETDVVSIYSDKIVISECKATKSQIDLETINNWVQIKIPAFYDWVKGIEPYKEKEIVFEYWSISGFTENALERLNHLKNTSKRFKVEYFNGNDLKDKAIQMKNKKLKEVVNDFFLNNKV